MSASFIDLIPWTKKPAIKEPVVETITWLDAEFEIPRLGYLTSDEYDLIREVDPKNEHYLLAAKAAVELHKAISDPEEWPSIRCSGLLALIFAQDYGFTDFQLGAEDLRIKTEHAELISDFLKAARLIDSRVRKRAITAIMTRVNPDWTDEMTQGLPGHLQNKLYAFQQEEERAGMGSRDQEKEARALEEDLKKSLGAIKSLAIDPTSENSTGNAADSGQQLQNSTVRTSPTSRQNIFLRRSRPGTRRSAKGFSAKSVR